MASCTALLHNAYTLCISVFFSLLTDHVESRTFYVQEGVFEQYLYETSFNVT